MCAELSRHGVRSDRSTCFTTGLRNGTASCDGEGCSKFLLAHTLNEDVSWSGESGVEESFAAAAAGAAASRSADAEFDGILPGNERARVDNDRFAVSEFFLEDGPHGRDERGSLAPDDRLVHASLSSAAAAETVAVDVERDARVADRREISAVLRTNLASHRLHVDRYDFARHRARQRDVAIRSRRGEVGHDAILSRAASTPTILAVDAHFYSRMHEVHGARLCSHHLSIVQSYRQNLHVVAENFVFRRDHARHVSLEPAHDFDDFAVRDTLWFIHYRHVLVCKGLKHTPETATMQTAQQEPQALYGGRHSQQGLTVIGQMSSPSPKYEFVGHRYTVLNVRLAPGESFSSETGALMHMSDNVRMTAAFRGFSGVAHNVLSGEDIARVRYINHGRTNGYVGLSPNQPMSIIIPIDISQQGGSINAKRGAYIAGPESISAKARILPTRSCAACCCGGMPPLIQAVSGAGIGFIAAGGTVLKKTLGPGEEILVDTESVVAFSNGMKYNVRQTGSFVTCCCGGEGCFNTVLEGPGDVYIQSLSYQKLVNFLVTAPPSSGGQNDKDDKKRDGGPVAPHTIER